MFGQRSGEQRGGLFVANTDKLADRKGRSEFISHFWERSAVQRLLMLAGHDFEAHRRDAGWTDRAHDRFSQFRLADAEARSCRILFQPHVDETGLREVSQQIAQRGDSADVSGGTGQFHVTVGDGTIGRQEVQLQAAVSTEHSANVSASQK